MEHRIGQGVWWLSFHYPAGFSSVRADTVCSLAPGLPIVTAWSRAVEGRLLVTWRGCAGPEVFLTLGIQAESTLASVWPPGCAAVGTRAAGYRRLAARPPLPYVQRRPTVARRSLRITIMLLLQNDWIFILSNHWGRGLQLYFIKFKNRN